MATELTVIECARNDHVDAEASIVMTTDSAAYVDCNDLDASKLIFQVTTTGDSQIVLVKAGMYSAEGIGDLSEATTAADTIFIGPVESARFKDTDGYIKVMPSTASASTAMTIRAILLP